MALEIDQMLIACQICALGPAVVGGETSLGINGKIKDDYTLALL